MNHCKIQTLINLLPYHNIWNQAKQVLMCVLSSNCSVKTTHDKQLLVAGKQINLQ